MIIYKSHFLPSRPTCRLVVGNSFIFVIGGLLHVAPHRLVGHSGGDLGQSLLLHGGFHGLWLVFVLLLDRLVLLDCHLLLHHLFGTLLLDLQVLEIGR